MSDLEVVGSSSKKKRIVTAPYGKGACNECRKAKARCEGRPECKRCLRLGHVCTRGEDHRKAFTRPLEQALRHKITVLEAKVDALANELAKSRISTPRTNTSAASPNGPGAGTASTSAANDPNQSLENAEDNDPRKERLNRTLQNLRVDDDVPSEPETDYPEDGKGAETDMDSNSMDGDANEDTSESESESEERIVERFVSRRRRRTTLFVESDELHEYGLTAVFRLPIHLPAHRSASQRRAIRLRRKRDESPLGKERYVLKLPTAGGTLVDGEDSRWNECSCEDECWRRYLPEEVVLTREEHDLLLDRLFIFFSSWCMRVIPSRFLRDMYRYLHPQSTQPSSSSSSTSLHSATSPTTPTPPKTPHYSPFLHLALLAVASAFSDNPHISHPATRALLADAAKSHIEAECARPSVSAVMALGLLGSYFSGKGEQTVGFVYFGMSARLSQALGLGADCSHWVQTGHIKARDLFDRFWCFHMVCAQDACWSLYVGREFGMPMGMGHGPSSDPHAIAELADPALDTMGWRMGPDELDEGGEKVKREAGVGEVGLGLGLGVSGSGQASASRSRERGQREREKEREKEKDAPPCHTFTAFVWTCSLMKKSRQIMTLMNALSSSEGSGIEIKRFVADIDIQLVTWYEDLPPELKLNLKLAKEVAALPHLLMMHLSFRWLLILLHRPFYRRQKGVEVDLSYKRCNVAAREVLTILRIWRKLYGSLRFTPITIVQCTFAAGTIYLLAAQQAATGRRPAPEAHAAAVADVEEVVGMLREIALSWECAAKVADLFGRLLEAHRRVGQGMHMAAAGVGATGVGMVGGRKGRFMRKKRGRTRGQVPIGLGEEGVKEGEGSLEPSPAGDSSMDVLMGGNGSGVFYADEEGQQKNVQQWQHRGHAHTQSLDDTFPPAHESSTYESSMSPATLDVPGAIDGGLHSDTDLPHSDTNEYVFTGFGGTYAQHGQGHPMHLHMHPTNSGQQAQQQQHGDNVPSQPSHPGGEDFSMSDEEIWNIFASQFNSAQNGGSGANPGGMYADWRVTGTGLGMDDGTSFADQPFMTFGPSPYVHPVHEAELDPPSDVDVDDEALHNLIATMRQDTFQY